MHKMITGLPAVVNSFLPGGGPALHSYFLLHADAPAKIVVSFDVIPARLHSALTSAMRE